MEPRPFANIAAYKFVDLEERRLESLRPALLARCKELGLRGTILLSPEGVNLFVSGAPENARALQSVITDIRPFSDLSFTTTYSSEHSFRRMLVKIKKEIIPFGFHAIKPAVASTERLHPLELRRWLDEGSEVLLLDTRNDYEVELGTFRNAVDLGLKHFRDFPRAVRKLDESLKSKAVVTFCTGGIRCEKAAPLMRELGFRNVYQLQRGILGYFDSCGGDHWNGECFVFDRRVALDPELCETDTEYCFNCQHILRSDDLKDHRYERGERCPYCAAP